MLKKHESFSSQLREWSANAATSLSKEDFYRFKEDIKKLGLENDLKAAKAKIQMVVEFNESAKRERIEGERKIEDQLKSENQTDFFGESEIDKLLRNLDYNLRRQTGTFDEALKLDTASKINIEKARSQRLYCPQGSK